MGIALRKGNDMSKRAVMAVSFGTSYEETRKLTIERFEKALGEHFDNEPVYRAWTSGMIMRKILKRDAMKVNNVSESLEAIKADGFDEILVQPSHILEGIEYAKIVAQLKAGKADFTSIQLGHALLHDEASLAEVGTALADIFSFVEDEDALVLMGHGSSHETDSSYEELEAAMHASGHENYIVGTIEGELDIKRAISKLKELRPSKVILAPFLIVSGDHALNDIGGDDEDSCKSMIKEAGFDVECVLKGLGEYQQIIDILLKRADEAKEI